MEPLFMLSWLSKSLVSQALQAIMVSTHRVWPQISTTSVYFLCQLISAKTYMNSR